jgi:hypothetical protein
MARGSAIPGIFAVLFVVGSLVYAVAAQMTEPPLEPARSFMHWQALWNDGTYGMKATFLVTWMSLLGATVVPLAAGASTIEALAAARSQPVMPTWPQLAWARMREPARAGIAAAFTALGLVFGGVCLVDPKVFTRFGFLADITLMLWPFSLIIGPLLLLDVALPASVVVAAVEELERQPGATPQQSERFHLRVGGRRFELGEAAWRQLAASDEVAVRSSAIFSRVLELRRRAG